MQDIINGGMYSVNFISTNEYKFNGIHPAIIVRTLKENKLYFCVPLSTYTKERWLKAKKSGFGCRILSSNSIARIDKYEIVDYKEIKNRWLSLATNEMFRLTYNELESLNNKLNEYMSLSSKKCLKEYDNYINQYNSIKLELINSYNRQPSIFNSIEYENSIQISIDKTYLNKLSLVDIIDILKMNIKEEFKIIKNNTIDIIIDKN